MKEASPDGVLAADPHISDQLSLAFFVDDLNPSVIERVVHGSKDSGIDVAGRSAAGQLGIDVVRASGLVSEYEDKLYVPINLKTHTTVARAIAENIGEFQSETAAGASLTWNNGEIQFGRLLDNNNLQSLDKDEVERAVANRMIAFDPQDGQTEPRYRINDNGSVTLPISSLEFVFNEQMLKNREQRFDVLHHGRAGLIRIMSVIEHEGSDVLPDFMVGGTVFSPGQFYVKIRENLDDEGKVRQLPSAATFDGNRLMGISPALDPYSRNRQFEAVNNGSQLRFDEAQVTVDVYRSTEISEVFHRVVDWNKMSPEQRKKTHLKGVSPLDVIKASDPLIRKLLLDAVSQKEVGALIITSHGVDEVPRGRTPHEDAQNMRETAKSTGRHRGIPAHLEKFRDLVEELKPAADRSRLLVADRLELQRIPNIVKSGDVRAIYMREYLGGGEKGVSMSKEDHSAIVSLVRKGTSIAWENEGDLRELHKSGLWVTPEASSRIEELDMVVAMYGSHDSKIGDQLAPQVDSFFKQLKSIVPVERLGVAHGNMAGLMEIADRLARENGLMSLGVGLDLSSRGQKEVNLLADGFQILNGDERLYRQEKLDKFSTVSVFNLGGFGTLEELFITVCSQKLNSCLPTPNILISEDNMYNQAVGMIEEVGKRGLGQSWLGETVHQVSNYEEASQLIKEFWNDPKAYWRKAGIPKAEIAAAYVEHQATLIQMGMRLPENLREAAETYEG